MRVPAFLNDVKQPVKLLRHRLRNEYIRRFFSFTPEDLLKGLRDLGIQPGDVVCVHSSFDQFLGFQGNLGDALQVLQMAVGSSGGLMMPTQPFQGSAIDYVRNNPITNIARTPSRMGMITELLRRTKSAVRSIHPTHPVAVWGTAGIALAGNDWEARTPCGKGTAYYRLLESNGKILMLGTGLQPMTFYHCVEELIEPMMPRSPFTTEVFEVKSQDAAGKIFITSMRLLERELSAKRRMSIMEPELKRRRFLKSARIGRLECLLLSAADVLEACCSMAKRGEFCYEGMSRAQPRHRPTEQWSE